MASEPKCEFIFCQGRYAVSYGLIVVMTAPPTVWWVNRIKKKKKWHFLWENVESSYLLQQTEHTSFASQSNAVENSFQFIAEHQWFPLLVLRRGDVFAFHCISTGSLLKQPGRAATCRPAGPTNVGNLRSFRPKEVELCNKWRTNVVESVLMFLVFEHLIAFLIKWANISLKQLSVSTAALGSIPGLDLRGFLCSPHASHSPSKIK